MHYQFFSLFIYRKGHVIGLIFSPKGLKINKGFAIIYMSIVDVLSLKMIDLKDFEFLDMYLKQNFPMLSEDKEALSEGESGGSSEDHHERHHDRSHHQQHHQPHHYPHSHHSLRGNLLSNGGGVTGKRYYFQQKKSFSYLERIHFNL